MTLDEYQNRAMTTCLERSRNIIYMLLNLQAEVGEFSGKLAKHLRKGKAYFKVGDEYIDSLGTPITHNEERLRIDKQEEDDLRKEAGDVLWQLSGLCSVMGWKLEDIAQDNLDKLLSRKERGVIDGNGDNR